MRRWGRGPDGAHWPLGSQARPGTTAPSWARRSSQLYPVPSPASLQDLRSEDPVLKRSEASPVLRGVGVEEWGLS